MDKNIRNITLDSILLPDTFKKYFWEYRGVNLNLKDDTTLIAERILRFGNTDALKWLLQYISDDFLRQLIKNSKNLDPKTVNYWNVILNE